MTQFTFLGPLTLLLLIQSPAHLQGQDVDSVGILRGRVVSLLRNEPVEGARIAVSHARSLEDAPVEERSPLIELITDSEGRFSAEIDPDLFDLMVEAFGFETRTETDVQVRTGQTTEVLIRVEAAPFALDEIVVMPSTFALLRDHVVSGQILSREELEVRPHLGNDLFRAVAQVPGVTAFDHSAVPYVRGARADEVLTVLDGLELSEPYHLKQWDGSLSIVDAENVQDVNLTTGGFTSEFGDASAGVLSMRTATLSTEGMRTMVGLDFMSSILKNEGTFAEGKGAWVLSARRGFLDLIFEITGMNEDEDLHPSYYDLYSKVEYDLRPGHRVSAHILHAGDDNHGVEDDSTTWRHQYGSSYAWVNWSADLTRATSVRSMISLGRVWRDRNGTDPFAPGSRPRVEVRDQADYDFLGLRQDWKHRISPKLIVKAGMDLRWGRTDYDYYRRMEVGVPNATDPARPDFIPTFDTLRVDARPSGNELGAYLAARAQPLDDLTLEGGLRYDRQSHTSAQQLAPRFNAAYRVAPRTNLRAAWGNYHQSHGLHQLWVADGDETFYPAQRAEHRVVGIEHTLESGIMFRAEAYQRLLSDPLPEYRNLEHHTQGLEEEGPNDRVFIQAEEGRAHGIELFAKATTGSWLVWAASYALSRTEEKIDEEWVPRPFDQRHAINLQLTLRPLPHWSFSMGWIYHSPWPCTSKTFSLGRTVNGYSYVTGEFGPMNQERLIPYHRIDFRVSRDFPLRKGNLLVYLDVFNATNRLNAQSPAYSVTIQGDTFFVEPTIHPQLEMMPSLGLRWVF